MFKAYNVGIVGMLVLGLFISSCSLNDSQTEEKQEFEVLKINKVENKDYNVKDIDLKNLNIGVAAGFLYDEGLIYISDIEQQVVNIYNEQFRKLSEIKDDRLTSPSLIAASEDTVYILDKLTLQVFEFKKSKSLVYNKKRVFLVPSLGQGIDVLDLEIFNSRIYVTFFATVLKEAKIVSINLKDEEVMLMDANKEEFMGYMGISDKNVLNFAQTMQYYEKVGKTGFKTGESKGFFLEENDLKPRGKFLSGSMPTDFFIKDSYYYVYSAGWSSVDRYDLSLKYIDSLATFKISDSHVVLKGDSEKMFFLMIYEQKLWEINKK